MHTNITLPFRAKAALVFVSIVAPALAIGSPMTVPSGAARPVLQDFILTAYYSPLPNQCCYVKGSYAADVVLNGEGTNGADGTEVYPGMAAGPKPYAFGTRVSLPGIGTVTVHDRGGAIGVLNNGVHRLDIWMGSGEEGLARALTFGVRHVKGTVYVPGSAQPQEGLAFSSFEAPISMLKSYLAQEPDLLALRPKLNAKGLSVQVLQEHLRDAGYFKDPTSGMFGPATQQALAAFLKDANLDEPSDQLTERAAAFLVAAVERTKAPAPFTTSINTASDKLSVIRAQRTLRFLGYYRGRTNGIYDEKLSSAIIAFQKTEKLVSAEATEPWAGTIGPVTRERVTQKWKSRLLASRARTLMDLQKVATVMDQKGYVVSEFLNIGDTGGDVKSLQRFLVTQGYLPEDKVTGSFGEQTQKAVIAYQMAVGIVDTAASKGAGFVGPATLLKLRGDLKNHLYQLVKSGGWGVL